jgi:hypothetical protein
MAKHNDSCCACCSCPCSNILRFIVIALFLCIEYVLLVYSVSIGHFFLTYFTYLSRLLFVLSMFFLLFSNFTYNWFRWQVMITLPFMIGVSLYLGIGVTIIKFFRPQLLIDDFEANPGDEGVAIVQLGDWIYHQLPFYETAIIAILLFKEASGAINHNLYITLHDPYIRWILVPFLAFTFACYLLLYVLIFDWDSQYRLDPLDQAAVPIWLLVAAMVVCGLIVLIIVYVYARSGWRFRRKQTLLFDDGEKQMKWKLLPQNENRFSKPVF